MTLQRIVRSICLGLPFPILFALYSVYLGTVRPEDESLRGLAGIQVACFAMAATAIAGFLGLMVRDGLRPIQHQFRRDLWDILWLNFFTVLGPPLYFVAVVLLGAAPANWIDLGMTPLLTMAAGLWSASASRRPSLLMWLGAGLATFGLATVVMDVAQDIQITGIAGVILASVSAIGTTGAGVFLQRIQGRDNPISPAALLPIRYVLPSILLAAIWGFVGWRLETGRIVVTANPGWFVVALLGLFVLPNYLYVVVVKKKGLLFLGFMWAMLPVFASIAEFIALGATGMSLSPWTTVVAGLLILGGTVVCDLGADEPEPEADQPSVAEPSFATVPEE